MNTSEYLRINFAQIGDLVVCFPPVVKIGEYFLLSVVNYKAPLPGDVCFRLCSGYNGALDKCTAGVISAKESNNTKGPIFSRIPQYHKGEKAYVVSIRIDDPKAKEFGFSLQMGEGSDTEPVLLPVVEEYKLDKFRGNHWVTTSFTKVLTDQSKSHEVLARGKGFIFNEALRKELIQQEDERRSASKSSESSMELSVDEAFEIATRLQAPDPKSKDPPQPKKKKKTPSPPVKGIKKKTPPPKFPKKPVRSVPLAQNFHGVAPVVQPKLHEFSPPVGMFNRPGTPEFFLTPDLIISSHWEQLQEYSSFVDKFLTEAQLNNGKRDGSLAVITRTFPLGTYEFFISTRSRLCAGFLFYPAN